MADYADYLVMFQSLITAVVVAQFLYGWRRMFRNRQWFPPHTWLQLGWSILLFFLLIQNWWGGWQSIKTNAESIPFFITSLVASILFSLLTDFVLPDERAPIVERREGNQCFRDSDRCFYSILIAMMILFIVRSPMKHEHHEWGNFIRGLAIATLVIGLCASCKWVRLPFDAEWVHLFVLCASVALLVCFISTADQTPKSTTAAAAPKG